jgi:hypothetical protein
VKHETRPNRRYVRGVGFTPDPPRAGGSSACKVKFERLDATVASNSGLPLSVR